MAEESISAVRPAPNKNLGQRDENETDNVVGHRWPARRRWAFSPPRRKRVAKVSFFRRWEKSPRGVRERAATTDLPQATPNDPSRSRAHPSHLSDAAHGSPLSRHEESREGRDSWGVWARERAFPVSVVGTATLGSWLFGGCAPQAKLRSHAIVPPEPRALHTVAPALTAEREADRALLDLFLVVEHAMNDRATPDRERARFRDRHRALRQRLLLGVQTFEEAQSIAGIFGSLITQGRKTNLYDEMKAPLIEAARAFAREVEEGMGLALDRDRWSSLPALAPSDLGRRATVALLERLNKQLYVVEANRSIAQTLQIAELEGLEEALTRAKALGAPPAPFPPTGDGSDHVAFDRWLDLLDELRMRAEQKALPWILMRDLGRLTTALATSVPERSAETLRATLEEIAREEGVSKSVDAASNRELRSLFERLYLDVQRGSSTVREAVDAYQRSIRAIKSALPDVPFAFSTKLAAPIEIGDDASPYHALIPAGSSVGRTTEGTYFVHASNGLFLSSGKYGIALGDATVSIGKDDDRVTASFISLRDVASVSNLRATIAGNGAVFIAADSARVDLTEGTVDIRGGSTLRKDPDGTLALTAGQLILDRQNGRGSLRVSDLTLAERQQGDGTRASVAGGHLVLEDARTHLRAEAFRLSMRGEGSHLQHARLEALGPTEIQTRTVEISTREGAVIELSEDRERRTTTTLAVTSPQFRHSAILADGRGESSVTLEHAPDGDLESVRLQSRDLTIRDPARGAIEARGRADGLLLLGDGGALRARVRSDSTTYTHGGNRLDVDGGVLLLERPGSGPSASLFAEVKRGTYTTRSGTFEIPRGGTGRIRVQDDGSTELELHADRFVAAGGAGALTFGDPEVHAKISKDRGAETIELNARAIDFRGSGKHGEKIDIDIAPPDSSSRTQARLSRAADGGRRFDFTNARIDVGIHEQRFHADKLEKLEVASDSEGRIVEATLELRGEASFTETKRGLVISGTDIRAEHAVRPDGSRLRLSLEEGHASLSSVGEVRARKLELAVSDRRIWADVASASADLRATLGRELGVTVDRVTVGIEADELGRITRGGADVGGFHARSAALNAIGTTRDGAPFSITFERTASGEVAPHVALGIPRGGHVALDTREAHVSIGSAQTPGRGPSGPAHDPTRIVLSQRNGSYRVDAEGIEADARWKGARILAALDRAAVSYDREKGEIVLENLRGSFDVELPGRSRPERIRFDVDKLDGYLVHGGFSGLRGGTIRLKPTSDQSRLGVRVETKWNSLPIAFVAKDARELHALASLQPNELHVVLEDPTRTGDLRLRVGPFEVEGNLDLLARLHTFDATRFLDNFVGPMTTPTPGVELFRGLTLDAASGVARLETTGMGPHGGIALILPAIADLSERRFYVWERSVLPGQQAASLVLQVGARHRAESGSIHTADVILGVAPGSVAELLFREGRPTVAGLPLPGHIKVPTSIVGGIRYGVSNPRDGTRVEAIAGAAFQPLSFLDKRFVDEPTRLAPFVGVGVGDPERWGLGVGAVIELDHNMKVKGGAGRIQFELKF